MLEKRIFLKGNKTERICRALRFPFFRNTMELQANGILKPQTWSIAQILIFSCIGYYYPARVWIGDSGIIYCTHEYEDNVKEFHSIVQLILDELRFHDLESVAMKLS